MRIIGKWVLLSMLSLAAWSVLFVSCVSEVEAEFDYRNNLIYIDGFALTEENLSYVSIKESFEANNRVQFQDITDASVTFENVLNGEVFELSYQSDGFYKPSSDFKAKEGESWQLFVELADGRRFQSTPETIPAKVGFSNLEASFDAEMSFQVAFNSFVPGHKLTIDLDDPAGESNFYLWKYKSYERLISCKTCEGGVLRGGECEDRDLPSWATQYYDYLCIGDCWTMRFNDKIPVFTDQFSDGERIESKQVAEIVYYRKQDILVEVQQYNINESTYDYFKTINDLVSESSGLNAPTPTALLGNLVNSDRSEETILGQFSAASVSTSRIYIDRDDLPATPVSPDPFVQLENCIGCPTNYPCEESRTRTSVKPIGWP